MFYYTVMKSRMRRVTGGMGGADSWGTPELGCSTKPPPSRLLFFTLLASVLDPEGSKPPPTGHKDNGVPSSPDDDANKQTFYENLPFHGMQPPPNKVRLTCTPPHLDLSTTPSPPDSFTHLLASKVWLFCNDCCVKFFD